MYYLKRKLFAIGLATLFALFAPSAPAQSFSLEQAMISPFPSELVVSKRGDKIAWAFNAEGKRNIWIAEAPVFTARQLTHYEDDDGKELTNLVFSPAGNAIAYVRGGDRNQAGEVPNPTSDPEGTKQQVWVADLRTGRPMVLGDGSGPVFSPAGGEVIWIRDGQFWIAPVSGGKERKLFGIRGGVSGPRWSPDGSQLAFATSRGDHSFIAIFDTRANRLRFLAPSVDRDVLPRWSPDGRSIAFIRLLNVTDTFSNDRERLQPWAILVADVQSGEARQVWRSGDLDNDSYPGLAGRFLAVGRRRSTPVCFRERRLDASLFGIRRRRCADGVDAGRV